MRGVASDHLLEANIEMQGDSGKPNAPKRERSRKRQRESSSKTDEEVHDSDMICGQHGDHDDQDDDQASAARFDEINQKLDKLLSLCPLIEDLKTELALLKEENTELKKSLQWATDEVNDLRNKLKEMRAQQNSSRDMLQHVQQDLQMQTIRNIKIEAQSRRSNIKFFGVREAEAESIPHETEKIVKLVLVNELKMPKEDVANLKFERVHRMPTKRSAKPPTNRPRPIIAKLSFYKDKGHIFKQVKNIDPALKIGVADDYPKEIDEMRKALLPVLKNAKRERASASFNVDRLVINSQIYRGPETQNFPFYAKVLSS